MIVFKVHVEIKYKTEIVSKLREGKWNENVLRSLLCPGKPGALVYSRSW